MKCARAAMEWQLLAIPKGCMPELQSSYRVLVGEKIEIPRAAKLAFLEKAGKDMAMEGKYEEWLDILSLELPAASRSFIDNPSFGHLLPPRSAAEEVAAEFWDSWRNTLMNDAVIGIVTESEAHGVNDLRDVATKFCKMCVRMSKNLPEYAVLEMTKGWRVFKGFMALIDHWPGAFGSSNEDVDYLEPPDNSNMAEPGNQGTCISFVGSSGQHQDERQQTSECSSLIVLGGVFLTPGLQGTGGKVQGPRVAGFYQGLHGKVLAKRTSTVCGRGGPLSPGNPFRLGGGT